MNNVLVKSTNEVIGFEDSVSIDEIQKIISNDQNGTISAYKPSFYDRAFREPMRKLGADFAQPKFISEPPKSFEEIIKPLKTAGWNLLAGVESGTIALNKVFMLDKIPAIKASLDQSQKGIDVINEMSKTENKSAAFANQFMAQIGAFVPTLPSDMALGGITRTTLLTRFPAALQPYLSRIPDFAIGMGEKAFVSEAQKGESVAKPFESGAESMAIGTLFGVANTIPRMTALGVAEANYNAIKENRLASGEEMLTGAANGAAFGIVFKAVEHLHSIGDNSAIEPYYQRMASAMEKGDIVGLKKEYDSMLSSDTLSKKQKVDLKEVFDSSVKGYSETHNKDFQLLMSLSSASHILKLTGDQPAVREGMLSQVQSLVTGYLKSKTPNMANSTAIQASKELIEIEAQRVVSEPLGESITKILSRGDDVRNRANKGKMSEPEIKQQFNDPNAVETLDYLAQYMSPKAVASMSGQERLQMANGPWQNLRDYEANFQVRQAARQEEAIARATREQESLRKSAADRAADEVQVANAEGEGMITRQPSDLQIVLSSPAATSKLVENIAKAVIEQPKAKEQAKSEIVKPSEDLQGKPGIVEKISEPKTLEEFQTVIRSGNKKINLTEEAVGFGERNKNTPGIVEQLTAARKEAQKRADDSGNAQAQTEAQLFNEAIKGAEGKLTVQGIRDTRAKYLSTGKPQTVNISPVEGVGETKTRGLSQGVEEKAIAKKLTENFGDLPQYKSVSMEDQAARANDLLIKDPAKAKRIAMGQEIPPEGLLPESVFVALENKAIAQGDVATLRDLATASGLTAEATTMGQRLRTLAEREPDFTVSAIMEVAKAREDAAVKKTKTKDIKKAKEKIVNEVKSEIKKTAPTKKDWDSFIRGLEC